MEKHTTPQSLEVEHKELHKQLKKAIDSGSKTGDAAKAVNYYIRILKKKKNMQCLLLAY